MEQLGVNDPGQYKGDKMSEKSMFEQNMEMWEKFVNRNMDLMFSTVEKTLEGSKAFQEQVTKAVDRALEESQVAQDRMAQVVDRTRKGTQEVQEQVNKAIATTLSAQMEATLVALKALERQVEGLSKRIDELSEESEEE
jgi:uncharacterized coiled-coil protein SlyX